MRQFSDFVDIKVQLGKKLEELKEDKGSQTFNFSDFVETKI
jgi:hypothetical protein